MLTLCIAVQNKMVVIITAERLNCAIIGNGLSFYSVHDKLLIL